MTMRSPPPTPCTQWILLLSATIILSFVSRGNSFQTNSHRSSACRILAPSSLASSSITATRVKMSSSSFQQARLAEQLRLSSKQHTQSSEEVVKVESSVELASSSSDNDNDTALSSPPSITEEAYNFLALEKEADTEALGPDGMPFAPMMTYQKYLTMQEKRVKVTIRYSAEAGLRPFYLTVANQIKSAHPDVLLEKRILPPVGSDAGGGEAIFEVIVDGKTVLGKKNNKMLKVSSRKSGGEVVGGSKGVEDGGKMMEGKKNAKWPGAGGETNTPDIAGGRGIFVSMERFEYEMTKARKRRRPNTMYKSKEDALRGTNAPGTADVAGQTVAGAEGNFQLEGGGNVVGQSTDLTEAVMRLERLKAMSTRK